MKVSDLDGSDGADVSIVIREHNAISSPKAVDVTAEQAQALIAKAVKNVTTIQVQEENGTKYDLLVSVSDLDKWLGDATKVLNGARFLKGRPQGYSPNRT